MNNLFLEQVQKFVDEFINLLNCDDYIPKSKVDSFFDKYKDIIEIGIKYKYDTSTYLRFLNIIKYGYKFVDIRNDKFVNKKLEFEKDYFDNMFKDVDENIILDEEQRRAIIIDEDYSLVVAGAGSGKTTTMVAKVKYLIERKHINPKNIILLSFTNNSVDDIDILLNDKFKLNVEVLTFHKLGMKFLRNSSDSKYEIISEAGIYRILEDYFLYGVFRNKALLEQYMDVFSEFLHLEKNALEFDTYDEYYEKYIDSKYELCKHELNKEIKRRINDRSIFLKTINGEYVKSNGELLIANYLYKNGIEYSYEEIYPHIVGDNRTYKPDFTIYDGDINIYIEYFGLAKLNMDKTIESETREYLKEIEQKRKIHKSYNSELIELFGRYENKDYFMPVLSSELTKRKIVKNKRSDKEIFYRLLETSKTSKYTNLIKLFIVFIGYYKEKGYSLNDFDKLIQDCNNDKIVNELKLIKDVYIYYEDKIRSFNKIDFEDMINYAYRNVETIKERKKNLDYKYVIIDEYQDVSYQKYSFIKKISDIFNSKIVAVGDDWQSIYSFSGSDMSLFVEFEKSMGYSEQIKIVNTYRNSQELIDTAGEFILKNESQIEKRLLSNKHLYKPIRLVEYDYDSEDSFNENMINKLVELIEKIYKARPNDNLLLLTRFNSEIDNLLFSKKFYRKNLDDKKIICKKVKDANIEILTVHKAKGLGYDRVILLNGINDKKGFPSKIVDEEVIKYIRGYDKIEFDENIEYPEERRLFYVALTRTRNELYIMVPSTSKYKSDFVKEIENNENVKTIEKL